MISKCNLYPTGLLEDRESSAAWAKAHRARSVHPPPRISNLPPPALSLQHHHPTTTSTSEGPAQESQQVQTLLKVIADMQGRLEEAERTIKSISLDRDQLQLQVQRLQQ